MVLCNAGAFNRMTHPLRLRPADVMKQGADFNEPHIRLGFLSDEHSKSGDRLAMGDNLL